DFVHRECEEWSTAPRVTEFRYFSKPARLRGRSKYRSFELEGYVAVCQSQRVCFGAHISDNECNASARYREHVSPLWAWAMDCRYICGKDVPSYRVGPFANSSRCIQCIQSRELCES